MPAAERQGASIVMIGSFNPAIFQPQWLANQGLIRQEEAERAEASLVKSDLADIKAEWFNLQVVQDRLTLATSDPRQLAPLRDLGSGLFDILSHTPIKLFGMNRHFHFEMPSADAWHAVGHLLAPKGPWQGIIDSPGLRSLLMQGRRKGGEDGVVFVKVEPSVRVKQGVFIETNEEVRAPDGSEGARWVSKCLVERWDSVMSFSEEVAQHLLRLVDV